jgi:riboflavin synthase
MFTGLVQALAEVIEVRDEPPGRRLAVACAALAPGAAIGASVAVSGCCLTVVAAGPERLEFQAGPETLARTTLGRLRAGDWVNLERSLRVGDELGGHFVSGHVDGVGRLADRRDERDWSWCRFGVAEPLTSQIVSKGSVAVDGVSLTVVDVESDQFSAALIPHTLAVTTLGRLRPGDAVNIETDLLAKYVQRAAQASAAAGRAPGGSQRT